MSFRRESGSDAGGVFREGMQKIVNDFYNGEINLFIKCPNAQQAINLSRHLFLPNPKYAKDTMALDMFEFVWKTMGLSIRNKLCFPFFMSSYVGIWWQGNP